MSYTDVDWFHLVASSHSHANQFVIVAHPTHRSPLQARLVVFTNKQTLRTTNAGSVEPETDVAGKSQSPWMSYTLSVEHENIGLGFQLANCY